MLCLSRRKNELVHVGDDVSVRVLEIHCGHVLLGFEAPRAVTILRDEVRQRIEAGEPLRQIEEILDQRENQTNTR